MSSAIPHLVKDQECSVRAAKGEADSLTELIRFRLKANQNTYAACMNERSSTRFDSHDFRYEEGPYAYHDTYVGGERFAGEEAI